MSDNDCISRSVLYEKTAEWEAQALHMVELHLHDDGKAEWRKWSTVLAERSAFKRDVADAPAVPHEMSAVEYLEARERLCAERLSNYGCNGCPMLQRKGDDCETIESNHPEEAVAIIEKWAREHPEERGEE